MCSLSGTSLIVVLSLISLIISSTLSAGCLAGFKGGSSLIYVKKTFFFKLTVFLTFKEHI